MPEKSHLLLSLHSLLWHPRNSIVKVMFAIILCCCQNSHVWDVFPRVPDFPVSVHPSPFPRAGCCNVGEGSLQAMRLLEKCSEGCFGMFDWKQDKTDHSIALCLSFCYLTSWVFHIMFSKSFHYAIWACGIMCYFHAEQNSDPLVLCAAESFCNKL